MTVYKINAPIDLDGQEISNGCLERLPADPSASNPSRIYHNSTTDKVRIKLDSGWSDLDKNGSENLTNLTTLTGGSGIYLFDTTSTLTATLPPATGSGDSYVIGLGGFDTEPGPFVLHASAGDTVEGAATLDYDAGTVLTFMDTEEHAWTMAGIDSAALATKEDGANKSTTIRDAASADDTRYPTEKAVADELADKVDVADKASVIRDSATADNVKFPTELAVATELELKIDAADKVNAVRDTASATNDNFPSEKAVADSLAAKADADDLILTVRDSATAADDRFPSELAVSTQLEGKLDATAKTANVRDVANADHDHLASELAVAEALADKVNAADKVNLLRATPNASDDKFASEKAVRSALDSMDTVIANQGSATNNPHSVTAAQVSLGNVDDTSDMAKPVSTLQAAAIKVVDDKLANYVETGDTVQTVRDEATAETDKYPSEKAVAAAVADAGSDTVKGAALVDLPSTGEEGVLYTTTGDNKIFRWDAATTAYVEMAGLEIGTTTDTAGDGGVLAALGTTVSSLGTDKEDGANKSAAIRDAASADDTKYPTEKAVRDELDDKFDADDVVPFVGTPTDDATVASAKAVRTELDLKQDGADLLTTIRPAIDAEDDKYVSEKAIADALVSVSGGVSVHSSATNNPHGVTAAQISLGDVDNTTDLNKPVSTLQDAAIVAARDSRIAKADIATTISAPGVDTKVLSEKAAIAAIDAKADAGDIVTTLSSPGLDTKFPSEKVVVTALDAKLDDADVVTSISAPGLDTKVPSEKSVSTALNTKQDAANLRTDIRDAATATDADFASEKAVRAELDDKQDASDIVTTVRDSASATDTAYPSELAVATAVETAAAGSETFVAANAAALPVTGEEGKIYTTSDDGKIFRWDAATTAYVELATALEIGTTAGTAGDGLELAGKLDASAIQTAVRADGVATDTDVASEAAVRTELDAKQDAGDIVTSVRSHAIAEDDKYPSEKAVAAAVAGASAGSNTVSAANFAALVSPGEEGLIYTTADDDKIFRWDTATTAFVELSAALEIGTTAGTAGDGLELAGKLDASAIQTTVRADGVATDTDVVSEAAVRTELDDKQDAGDLVTTVRDSASATDTAYPSELAVASAVETASAGSNTVSAANFAALVTPGEEGKIYTTADDNKIFRWDAATTAFVELSASLVIGTTADTAGDGAVLAGKLDASAIQTSIRADGVATDTDVVSEEAVRDALESKVNTSDIVTTVRDTATATDSGVVSELAVATVVADAVADAGTFSATSFGALPSPGEAGLMYTTTDDDKLFRYDTVTSAYVELSAALEIGTTAGTAGDGLELAGKLDASAVLTGVRADGVATDAGVASEKAVRDELELKQDAADLVTTVRDVATATDVKYASELAVSQGLADTLAAAGTASDTVTGAALVDLPVTGEEGKVYVTTGDNLMYRWDGTSYVPLGAAGGLEYKGSGADVGEGVYSATGTTYTLPAATGSGERRIIAVNPATTTTVGVASGSSLNGTTDGSAILSSSAVITAVDTGTGEWTVDLPTTATDLSLDNVDNTSDTDKPVSTLQASAIAAVNGNHSAANKAAFPGTGVVGHIYNALDTGNLYRWDTATTDYIMVGGDVTTGTFPLKDFAANGWTGQGFYNFYNTATVTLPTSQANNSAIMLYIDGSVGTPTTLKPLAGESIDNVADKQVVFHKPTVVTIMDSYPDGYVTSVADDTTHLKPELSDFPAVGLTGHIYVAEDTNILYRWDGASYTQLVAGSPANATTDGLPYRGTDISASENGSYSVTSATYALPDATGSHTIAMLSVVPSGATTTITVDTGDKLNGVMNGTLVVTEPTVLMSFDGGTSGWTISSLNKTTADLKLELGITNVDNTTDLLKPVSTATQNVFDGLKTPVMAANAAAFPSPTGVTGVLYLAEDTGILSRWDTATSAYIEVSTGLTLGVIAGTAADGGTVAGLGTDKFDKSSVVAVIGSPTTDDTVVSEKAIKSALDLKQDSSALTTVVRDVASAEDTKYPSEKAVASAVASSAAESETVVVAIGAALPGTGEEGKIYTTSIDNKIFRWDTATSAYIELSASLVIGTTATTAADGAVVAALGTDKQDVISLATVVREAATATDLVFVSEAAVRDELDEKQDVNDLRMDVRDAATSDHTSYVSEKSIRTELDLKQDAGLVTTIRDAATAEDTKFASEKAVRAGLDGKANAGDIVTTIGVTGADDKIPSEQAVREELTLKQDAANLRTDIRDAATATDADFSSEKAVRAELDAKQDVAIVTAIGTVAASSDVQYPSEKAVATALLEFNVTENFANLAAFDAVGQLGKIYLAEDTGMMYRWDAVATDYEPIGSAAGLEFKGTGADNGQGVYSTTATTYNLPVATGSGDRRIVAIDPATITTVGVASGSVFDGTTDGTRVFDEPFVLVAVDVGANRWVTNAGKSNADLKVDLGLENVDNTTDANKPVSDATATAIAAVNANHSAATESGFPAVGKVGHLYNALDTGNLYRWDTATTDYVMVAGDIVTGTLPIKDFATDGWTGKGIYDLVNSTSVTLPSKSNDNNTYVITVGGTPATPVVLSVQSGEEIDGVVDGTIEFRKQTTLILVDSAAEGWTTSVAESNTHTASVLANFPTVGRPTDIYVAEDTNILYRWDGASYVQLVAGSPANATTDGLPYRGTDVVIADQGTYNVTSASYALPDSTGSHTIAMISVIPSGASSTITVNSGDKLNGVMDGTLVITSPTVIMAFDGTNTGWTATPAARSDADLKVDLGLENVDNTTDADKPVSTLQAAAIAAINGNHSAADLASFPSPGVVEHLYTALDTGLIHRYDTATSAYVQVGGGESEDLPFIGTNVPITQQGSYNIFAQAALTLPKATGSKIIAVISLEPTTTTTITVQSGDKLNGLVNGTLLSTSPTIVTVFDGTIDGWTTSPPTKSTADLKTELEITNVDNTSDALKPVSNATQDVFDNLNTPIMAANLAGFTLPGKDGVMYLAKDTGIIHRWNGTALIAVSEPLVIGTVGGTAADGGIVADLGTDKLDKSAVVSSVGTPATDDTVASEKAVRAALDTVAAAHDATKQDANKLVTTIGTPGLDTNFVSEKAIRTGLDAAGAEDTSKQDGNKLVTTIADPGLDDNYVSEKAIRAELNTLAGAHDASKQDAGDLVTTISTPGLDDKFPSEKAVRTELDAIAGAHDASKQNVSEKTETLGVTASAVHTKYPTEKAVRDAMNQAFVDDTVKQDASAKITIIRADGVATDVGYASEKSVRDAIEAIPSDASKQDTSAFVTTIRDEASAEDTKYPSELATIKKVNAVLAADTTKQDASALVTVIADPGLDTTFPSEKAVRAELTTLAGAHDASKQDGNKLVTTIGTPGLDDTYVSEKAIRSELTTLANAHDASKQDVSAKVNVVRADGVATDAGYTSEKAVRDAIDAVGSDTNKQDNADRVILLRDAATATNVKYPSELAVRTAVDLAGAEDTDKQDKADRVTTLRDVATATDLKYPSELAVATAVVHAGDTEDFADEATFPTTGVVGKVYVAKDTNVTYRWDTALTDYAVIGPLGGLEMKGTNKSNSGKGIYTFYNQANYTLPTATGSGDRYYLAITTAATTVIHVATGDYMNNIQNDTFTISNTAKLVIAVDSVPNRWALSGVTTKLSLGLENVDNTSDILKPVSTATQNAIDALDASDVGLGNVNNTADVDKPVSTLQAAAISSANGTEDYSAFGNLPVTGVVGKLYQTLDTNKLYRWNGTAYLHTGINTVTDLGLENVNNTTDLLKPVSTATQNAINALTKADVDLGNVDNTSDLLKPVSTATATAIGLVEETQQVANAAALPGTGKDNTLYITQDDNACQRWNGTSYTKVGPQAGLEYKGEDQAWDGAGVYVFNAEATIVMPAATGSGDRYVLAIWSGSHSVVSLQAGDKCNDVTNWSYDVVDDHSKTITLVDSFAGWWLAMGVDTADTLGLGNVDNTTDLLKPISTATQNALDALKIPIFKADFASLPSTGNPGVIYTTEDDDKMFVWDTATSAYQEASAGGGGGTTLGGVNFFNAGDIPNSSWLAYTILEEDLTLTANVPESRGYCGFNPTATITLNVDKHVSGTFTNIGTVTISSAGVITWVGFAAQTLVEGTALRVTSPADTLGATDLFLTIAGSMPLPS